MNLSKDLTIVIPCKNEGLIIKKTLTLLNQQTKIKGVDVVRKGTTIVAQSPAE